MQPAPQSHSYTVYMPWPPMTRQEPRALDGNTETKDARGEAWRCHCGPVCIKHRHQRLTVRSAEGDSLGAQSAKWGGGCGTRSSPFDCFCIDIFRFSPLLPRCRFQSVPWPVCPELEFAQRNQYAPARSRALRVLSQTGEEARAR